MAKRKRSTRKAPIRVLRRSSQPVGTGAATEAADSAAATGQTSPQLPNDPRTAEERMREAIKKKLPEGFSEKFKLSDAERAIINSPKEQLEAARLKREEAMFPGSEAARRQIERQQKKPEPQRPKAKPPGPRPAKDWPTHVKNKVNDLKQVGEPVPSASYFVDHCRDTLGVVPDLRAMQRLLKTLRGG